jgi:hypothetical protein
VKRPVLLLAAGLALAGSAGYLTSQALGTGSQQPTRTVTIDVGTGAQGVPGEPGQPGPPGPKGDPGLPGAESCPAGYSFGAVLINAPKGQVQIATCIKD